MTEKFKTLKVAISYYLDTFALYRSLCTFQCRRNIWERGDWSSQDLGRLATPIPIIRGQIMPTNIFDNPAALLSIYYLEPHSYFARLQRSIKGGTLGFLLARASACGEEVRAQIILPRPIFYDFKFSFPITFPFGLGLRCFFKIWMFCAPLMLHQLSNNTVGLKV